MKTKLKTICYQEFKRILREVGGERATKAKYEQYKIEEQLENDGIEYISEEKT